MLVFILLLLLLYCGNGENCTAAQANEGLSLGQPVPVSESKSEQAPIDFLKDIYPIFQGYCLHCHGPSADGDLRLDRGIDARRGGHTGGQILSGDLQTNSLWQRVSTSDVSIRMPKDGPPLPEQQLELLRRWIEQGTPWIDPPEVQAARIQGITLNLENLGPWDPRQWSDERIEAIQWYTIRFGLPIVPILLWLAACDRARQWQRESHPRLQGSGGAFWRWLAGTPRSVQAMICLGVLFTASVFFYQSQARWADAQIVQLQSEIEKLNYQIAPKPVKGGKPRLVRPNHPLQLGGIYYRGNDERSSRLFNGGFYRTCTMEIGLHRSGDGSRLNWGDTIDDQACQIKLTISQSPGATDALFAPAIMETSFFSSVAPGSIVTDPDRQIFPLKPDGEKRWSTLVPVDLSEADTNASTGQLYLCRTSLPTQGGAIDLAHYGAEYRIRLDSGTIAPDSELWLCCLYRTANVLTTPEGKIADDEWFSFRPIPEIIGQQYTDDPVLLGIEAYRSELDKPNSVSPP